MAEKRVFKQSISEDRLDAALPSIPPAHGDFLHPAAQPHPYSSYTRADEESQIKSNFRIQSHPSRPSPDAYSPCDRDPFDDDAAIPLQQHPHQPSQQQYFGTNENGQIFPPYTYDNHQLPPRPSHTNGKSSRKREKTSFWSRHTPWFIYTISLVQIIVFAVELIRNAILTGSPIEIHPAFNPMIGPSPYLLINMGARYVSCMRNMEGIQNSNTTISWPCPNQTDSNFHCTLSELCGFNGVPNPVVGGTLSQTPAPNQWWRFIVPIFLHAGIIHITFNLILQLLLGGDMERAIGPLRMAIVYFSSGIFGFVLGGNFAASGIESCGASGAIFGIIALDLLDILYTWQNRPRPIRDLTFIILDILISFVLGLLPGLDNFSHIGGFLMGLVLGICLLRSPAPLQKRIGDFNQEGSGPGFQSDGTRHRESQVNLVPKSTSVSVTQVENSLHTRASSLTMLKSPRTFFSGRKPLWWAWWLLRVGALAGVISVFIVLVQSFYSHHDTQCPGCKYLSCLPVSNWCDLGQLTFNNQTTSN